MLQVQSDALKSCKVAKSPLKSDKVMIFKNMHAIYTYLMYACLQAPRGDHLCWLHTSRVDCRTAR